MAHTGPSVFVELKEWQALLSGSDLRLGSLQLTWARKGLGAWVHGTGGSI